MDDAPISFARDIMPVFSPFREQMIWRFDLTRHEDVAANAKVIQIFIGGEIPMMPPQPFPPFSKAFVAGFGQWIDQGCPP